MKKTVATLTCAVALAFGALASVPAAPVESNGAGIEQAAAQGKVKKVGDNTAELVTDILVPILIVGVGVFALVAFAKREVAMALSAVAIGLIAGLFLITPKEALDSFEGVYKAIF